MLPLKTLQNAANVAAVAFVVVVAAVVAAASAAVAELLLLPRACVQRGQCAKLCACQCAQNEDVHSCVCTIGVSRECAGVWRRSVGAREARRAVSGRSRAARGRAAASVGGAGAAATAIRGPVFRTFFSVRPNGGMMVTGYDNHTV